MKVTDTTHIPEPPTPPRTFRLDVTQEELERIFILSYRGEAINRHSPTLARSIRSEFPEVEREAVRRFRGVGVSTVLI